MMRPLLESGEHARQAVSGEHAGHAITFAPRPARSPARRAALLGSRPAMAVLGMLLGASFVVILRAHGLGRAGRPLDVPEPVPLAAPSPAPAATESAAPRASTLPTPVIHPVTHPPAPSSGKTAERLAADVFHSGDRRATAKAYADLAARYPNQAAIVAAAAILAAGAQP